MPLIRASTTMWFDATSSKGSVTRADLTTEGGTSWATRAGANVRVEASRAAIGRMIFISEALPGGQGQLDRPGVPE